MTVDELRALLSAATPGPWEATDWHLDDGPNQWAIAGSKPEVVSPGRTGIWPGGIQKLLVADVEYSELPHENAALIVALRNNAEALLDTLTRQAEHLAVAREALEQCGDQFAFYADEHRKTGKVEKAATNERFRDIARAAIERIDAR